MLVMVNKLFKLISRLRFCFLKSISGSLSICLLVFGITNVKATTITPEQAVLEKRIHAVRHILHEQSGETQSKKLAQWPNWGNWGNWPNWPNWGNWYNY